MKAIINNNFTGWHFLAATPVKDRYMTLINKDYVYEFADTSYCSIIGKDPNEVLNNTLAAIWGDENFHKIIKECVDRCFAGIPVDYEGWFSIPGNGHRYYKIHYYPYKSEDGHTTHVISALWDITEAKNEAEIFNKCNPVFLKRLRKKHFGVIHCDIDGRFLFVNNTMVERTGFNQQWFAEKTIYDFVMPEEKNDVSYCFNSCLKGKQIHNYEFSYINAFGEKNWIKTDFSPVKENGTTSSIIGVVHDITKLKLMERAFLNQRAQMESIICESPIPQFMIGKDHKVIYWNKALEDIRGITSREMVGTKNHWKAFYEYERPCMADLIVDGTEIEIKKWYHINEHKANPARHYKAMDFFKTFGPGGRWLYFSAIPVKDARGNIIGAVEMLEDATDSKMAEETIRLAEQKCMDILKVVNHEM